MSFKSADTAALAGGRRVKRFVNIEKIALRKLRQLQIAGRLDDLRAPPGNRLEALTGDHRGQHSIRINDQYRICFRWTAASAKDVEIVDYPRGAMPARTGNDEDLMCLRDFVELFAGQETPCVN